MLLSHTDKIYSYSQNANLHARDTESEKQDEINYCCHLFVIQAINDVVISQHFWQNDRRRRLDGFFSLLHGVDFSSHVICLGCWLALLEIE